eukprot:TRINITY_DN88_c0_g1_i1.p1 TRINITY_DN88_c0_g1~~TRINITY_DN88_c0_g1_i1.p1  ORF type:complete len:528 (+),score=121.13 TRINITY_DN88_c0_g1_i1:70-1653(+)
MSSQLVCGRFSNQAQQVGQDQWAWTAMVSFAEGAHAVQKAVLHLHPTFRPRRVDMLRENDGGFTSPTFTGWGTFMLRAELQGAAGDSVTLEHQLSFSDGGSATTFEVRLPQPKEAAAPRAEGPSTEAPRAAARVDMSRSAILGHLKETPFLDPSTPNFWHGRGVASRHLDPPTCTWQSRQRPRDDHDAPEWLTASEYTDTPAVFAAKCDELACLLRQSKRTVLYTGAGISAPAGIGQAARGGGAGGGKSTDATPTFTHFAAGALSDAGLLHGWVQQNHDGLPQKAGFPQENINEIHGSWYDPANPVVKYSGSLHSSAYPWMRREADTADLVLVLGTSLGGLNADQMATKPAGRSRSGKSLGTVIINLQQTEHDGKATLRCFGKADDVMRGVLRSLAIAEPKLQPRSFPAERRVAVPYDRQGKRSKTERTWLDLSDGAKIKLTENHNIQGAQQPHFMHIGATEPVRVGSTIRQPAPGHGVVERRDDTTSGFVLRIEGVRMLIGQWWLDVAARGAVAELPIVNLAPERA